MERFDLEIEEEEEDMSDDMSDDDVLIDAPPPPPVLAITYQNGRNAIIISPEQERNVSTGPLVEATPPPPEPGSCLEEMLGNIASSFADTLVIPRDGDASAEEGEGLILAHRVILLQDPMLAACQASAESEGVELSQLVVDESRAAVLARVRALYGWEGPSPALRAHLLKLAADAAAGLADDLADACVRTANGKAFSVHRCIFASRSEWFRAAFAHAARDGRTAEVIVGLEDTPAELLGSLLPYLYTGHLVDAGALLTPELIVPTCHLADQLLLEPLRARAIELMRDAVDDANAPSLFQVAVSLQEGSLLERCMERMVRGERQLGSSEHFAELPEEVQALVHSLAQASRVNPLCTGVSLTSSREFLAILRESLDEQVSRHEQAVERQRREEELRTADYRDSLYWWARPAAIAQAHEANARVNETLNRRAAQIRMLREYIRTQEAAFDAKHRRHGGASQSLAATEREGEGAREASTLGAGLKPADGNDSAASGYGAVLPAVRTSGCAGGEQIVLDSR